MRSVSLFVGVLSMYLLFTNTEIPTPSIIEFTIKFIFSVTFVVYGVGGNKLLSITPFLSVFSKPMKLSFKKIRVN